jgi:iron(III) transport system substrate-binding protein
LDWALTDTDDATIEKDSGNPVELVFPDQAEGQFGTLLIPNTIGVLQDAPHPAAAALLADYLMSEKVEARLTMGNGAQFPIWPNSSEKSRLTQGITIRWAEVDFELVAQDWDSTLERIKRAFDADKKQ